MSIIDKALQANRTFAANYNRALGKHPAPSKALVFVPLAVVTGLAFSSVVRRCWRRSRHDPVQGTS